MNNSSDWARDYFEHGYGQRWPLAAPDERVRRQTADICRLLQLSAASRLVDIGCGHGRHALALAEDGFRVIGVDFAERLLSRARHLAQLSGAHVDWIRGDMRMLPLDNQCADATLILDSFGFFETEQEQEAVLREARRILRNGGLVMLKVVNGVPILEDFHDSAREDRDDVEVSIANTLTSDPPRLTQRLAISGSRGQGQFVRRQRLYRVEELRNLLEGVGFSVTGVFADTDGTPFNPAKSSTIWIAGRS